MEQRPLPTALYCRLSREDGDRMESDSIGNQRKLLEAYIENHPELTVAECYADDGYTGTNFQRPAFQRMLRDDSFGAAGVIMRIKEAIYYIDKSDLVGMQKMWEGIC